VEAMGSPRFLGNPRDHGPCSPTPAGPIALFGADRSATDTVPAFVHGEDSQRLTLSGLNHTAFDLAVYASQGGSPLTTQDSLLAAGPALPGGIRNPQGPDERFPSSRLFLLSQAFLAQGQLACPGGGSDKRVAYDG
jgi:hypothetical protein